MQAPPQANWTSLVSEADLLLRSGNYKQAEVLYTRALLIQPNTHVYLSRSQCRCMYGNTQGALQDADVVLKESNHIKGMLCKADALYCSSDFEMAMVWYVRGMKARPDIPEFAMGVEKCKDSIRKAIESFDSIIVRKQMKKSLDPSVLEELGEDYVFLKELRRDSKMTKAVKEEAQKALEYLDVRIEFWKARNPSGVSA